MSTAVLHRRTSDGILIAYARSHLRASVSLSPQIFAEGITPPDHLTLTADGLREPISPHDQQAARVVRCRARAESAQTLARQYQAVAARHEARLALVKNLPSV